jgi:hypothetical protein
MSFFDIKHKIDESMYRSFNFVSDIYFHLRPQLKALLSNNKAYQDKYAGKRCFILGTGPSLETLTEKQLLSLEGEILFAVNSIYKAPVVSRLTPTFYALLDNDYWKISTYTFQDVFDRYASHPPTIITDWRAKSLIPSDVDSIVLYTKNYPIDIVRYDLSGNLSIAMNVIGTCILSAIYMGFKEIYLLGCDYSSFCGQLGNHCYDDEAELEELPKYNLSFYLKYYHLTTEFHYAISKLAKSKGVQVINSTPSSLLDAYPRRSLDCVL